MPSLDFLKDLLHAAGAGVADVGKGVGAAAKWYYNSDPQVQAQVQARANAAQVLKERLFGEQMQEKQFAQNQQFQQAQMNRWTQDDQERQQNAQTALTQRNFENARQTNSDVTSGAVRPVDPALTMPSGQVDPNLSQQVLGVQPGNFRGGSVTAPSPDEINNPSVYAVPGMGDARFRASTPQEYQSQQSDSLVAKTKAQDAAHSAVLDAHFKSPEFQAFAKDNPDAANAAVMKARFGVEPTKMTLDNLGASYMQRYQQTKDPRYLNLYHQIYPAKAEESEVDPKYLQMLTKTTGAGRQYFAGNDFKGDKAGFAAAQHSGVPVVDAPTDEMLSEVDNARLNLHYMLGNIQDTLATDPTGRLYQAPVNTIAKVSQSNPKLAAIGTYRSAAIQAMRAVAGSKGLRINKSEIEMAQQNDIPKDTDTLPTAKEKLSNMLTFLDNVERAHLVRDRSKLVQNDATTGGTQPAVIRVKEKATGRMGSLPVNEFDPNKFEKQ